MLDQQFTQSMHYINKYREIHYNNEALLPILHWELDVLHAMQLNYAPIMTEFMVCNDRRQEIYITLQYIDALNERLEKTEESP